MRCFLYAFTILASGITTSLTAQQYFTAENTFAVKLGTTKPLYDRASALPTDSLKLKERKANKPRVIPNFAGRRQMITHNHWMLNDQKHNIPSYHVKPGDVLTLRKWLQNSWLYASATVSTVKIPFWVTWNPATLTLTMNQMPGSDQALELPADLLKVIEFYARV